VAVPDPPADLALTVPVPVTPAVCHVCGGPVTAYRRDLDQRPQHQDTIREYTMSCPGGHVFARQVMLDPPPFP
jgi:hypothetical protein